MSEKETCTPSLPLTSGDLRELAAYVDRVERSFGPEGRETRLGEPVTNMDIQIALEGSEEPVGSVVYYDGWIGFVPSGWVVRDA